MSTYLESKETTFYQELQKLSELDLRDNRGKRHDLSFILLGVIIALLRKRDGNMSSIHRSMVNTHTKLCRHLVVEVERPVSRAQLPRILEKVNGVQLEELLFKTYRIELTKDQKQWFAADGKELRGSIESGKKRGQAIVQIVRHCDRAVLGQKHFRGDKESEKPCLKALVEATKCAHQKLTADALHLYPDLTDLIEQNRGIFIIGLKENQKHLLKDMVHYSETFCPKNEYRTMEKGHGRFEKRDYSHFDVQGEYFDKRWDKTKFRSLFKVVRFRQQIKTSKQSTQISYYISNAKWTTKTQSINYFDAIRNHWQVESNNHVRDNTLKEDQLRTKKTPSPKI